MDRYPITGRSLEWFFDIDGDLFERQYKRHLSGYWQWKDTDEGKHAGFGGLKCILNDANELADAAKWSKSDLELFAPTVELRHLIHDYSKG